MLKKIALIALVSTTASLTASDNALPQAKAPAKPSFFTKTLNTVNDNRSELLMVGGTCAIACGYFKRPEYLAQHATRLMYVGTVAFVFGVVDKIKK